MTRSPDSLSPSVAGQPDTEKRDDKALTCWQEGEANLRAATEVNAVTASSNPPGKEPPFSPASQANEMGCLKFSVGSGGSLRYLLPLPVSHID